MRTTDLYWSFELQQNGLIYEDLARFCTQVLDLVFL